MKLVFVAGAALLLGVLLGLDHVRNRFEHGPRSRKVLAVEAVLSYLVALYIAASLFPWALHLVVLVAVPLALPLFTLMAVVTVEARRLGKQQEFDSHISAIEREITSLMEEREETQRRLVELRRRQQRSDVKASSDLFRQRQLRARVEGWTQEGGFARIRSLKIEDWQRDMAGAEPEDLRRKLALLEDQVQECHDEGEMDRAEQARVQMALAELKLLGAGEKTGSSGAPEDEGDLDQKVDRLVQRAEEQQARLRELEEELGEWRGKKRFFLDQKLWLD